MNPETQTDDQTPHEAEVQHPLGSEDNATELALPRRRIHPIVLANCCNCVGGRRCELVSPCTKVRGD